MLCHHGLLIAFSALLSGCGAEEFSSEKAKFTQQSVRKIESRSTSEIDGGSITLAITNLSNRRGCLLDSEFQDSGESINVMMFLISSSGRAFNYIGIEGSYIGTNFVKSLQPGETVTRRYTWRSAYASPIASLGEPDHAEWLGALYEC